MTLRVGLIGCGGMAGAHLTGWLPEQEKGRVTITAISDVDDKAIARVQKQVPEAKAYKDFLALIREAPVDAVDIMLPHDLHLAAILAAAGSGKHWLCEKPLCMTLDEAKQIESAMAKTKGLVGMSAHNQLHMASVQEARRLIEQGALGRVYLVNTNDSFLMSDLEPGALIGSKGHMPIQPGTWRNDPKQMGGGELIDTGYHPSYLITFLAGAEPVHVEAVTGKYRHDHFHSEDTATVLIRYANGVTGLVRTSWGIEQPVGQYPFHVVGERGELYGNWRSLFFKPTRFTEPARWDFEQRGSFQSEVEHFVACVLDGATCISPYQQGITVLKLILAAYESAKRKQ
ncbi:MAG: Gfo/Idh/MocA family oxidoreductase [Verrucomicrobia bacterium]|nr:Gfo/Idh/MocA family oxidoreductase [Verrucomicrobiota bacterium]